MVARMKHSDFIGRSATRHVDGKRHPRQVHLINRAERLREYFPARQ